MVNAALSLFVNIRALVFEVSNVVLISTRIIKRYVAAQLNMIIVAVVN